MSPTPDTQTPEPICYTTQKIYELVAALTAYKSASGHATRFGFVIDSLEQLFKLMDRRIESLERRIESLGTHEVKAGNSPLLPLRNLADPMAELASVMETAAQQADEQRDRELLDYQGHKDNQRAIEPIE